MVWLIGLKQFQSCFLAAILFQLQNCINTCASLIPFTVYEEELLNLDYLIIKFIVGCKSQSLESFKPVIMFLHINWQNIKQEVKHKKRTTGFILEIKGKRQWK